jgi:hypothetical protein
MRKILQTAPKPKLTDTERHKRFVETARKVEASENIDDFDKAFSSLKVRSRDATDSGPTRNGPAQNEKNGIR